MAERALESVFEEPEFTRTLHVVEPEDAGEEPDTDVQVELQDDAEVVVEAVEAADEEEKPEPSSIMKFAMKFVAEGSRASTSSLSVFVPTLDRSDVTKLPNGQSLGSFYAGREWRWGASEVSPMAGISDSMHAARKQARQ